MERDEKGRFVKGKTPGGAIPINEGIAKDYQARSVAARRENRTLREALRQALEEDAGGGHSRLEAIARKAMSNHFNGKLTFRDLKDLSAVLGETTVNIKTGDTFQLVPKDDEQARLLAKLMTPEDDGV